MPIWTDAYLADTRHLTAAQHGAYLLLLMEAWRRPSCSLPNDDRQLARWASMSDDEWVENRDVVMGFWRLNKRRNEFQQLRQLNVRDKVREKSKKQSDRATSGWRKRKKQDATAKPKRMPDGRRDDATKTLSTSITPDTLSGVSPPSEASPEPKANPTPKRETRLPDGWEPSPTDRKFAKSEGLTDADIDRTAARFRDYWAGKGGKSGRKADWPATWRNWVRRDADERSQAGGPRQNGHAAGGRHRQEPPSFAEAAMRYAARGSSPDNVPE